MIDMFIFIGGPRHGQCWEKHWRERYLFEDPYTKYNASIRICRHDFFNHHIEWKERAAEFDRMSARYEKSGIVHEGH